MASDNGNLETPAETQPDALDQRIAAHRRAGPPAGLVERCLETIPRAESSIVIQTTPEIRPASARRLVPSWFIPALAAMVLLAIGVSLLLPSVQMAREASRRSVAHQELVQKGFALAEQPNGAGKWNHVANHTSRGKELEFFLCPSDRSDGLVFLLPYLEESRSYAENGRRRDPIVDDSAIPFGNDNYSVAKPLYESSNHSNLAGGDVPRRHNGQEAVPGTVDSNGAESKTTVFNVEGRVGRLESEVEAVHAKTRESVAQGIKYYRDQDGDGETRILSKIPYDSRKEHDPYSRINDEAYLPIVENPFATVARSPLSTFSVDVDTAAYSNVRRFLSQRQRPPRAAVRIEELLNYFHYDYPQPRGDDPFSVSIDVADCPWAPEHRLVRIGLKGREIHDEQRPPSNLVFLVDVSGSMAPDNRLPLFKTSLKMLVDRLNEGDRVAIVSYAGESRLVLASTSSDSKETIKAAIDGLNASGSTNGGAGIQQAYEIAKANFITGGTNRVILGTDGDFNVGMVDRDQLVAFVAEKAKDGVFLSVLGFGFGNLKDATMERLADKGNGHYAYIDSIDEARKVLVDEMAGTLVTIAKDVKLQIEFNPAQVTAYRQIGYENRVMPHQDFNDDRKDAGDIGAGHTVTALYEIVPAGAAVRSQPGVELKYQKQEVRGQRSEVRDQKSDDEVGRDGRSARVSDPAESATRRDDAISRELLTLKLRYKDPDGTESRLIETAVTDRGDRLGDASKEFRFAAAVAAFGLILRDSAHRGTATLDGVLELAAPNLGPDKGGYRAEFLKLVRAAKELGLR